MIDYICYDPDGNLTLWGNCQPDNLALLSVAGATVLAGLGTDRTHHVLGGQLAAYTPAQALAKNARPAHTCRWDNALMAWVDLRDLAALKADKWAEVKQAREAAQTAPLVTPFGVFDADEAAQSNITRAVLLANNLLALGYPVAIDFTLHDNSVRVMDAPAMVQVGLILGGRVQTVRAHATVLRAQIEAASAEALALLAW